MKVIDLMDRIMRATNYVYNDQTHMLNLLNDALNQLTNDAKLEGTAVINVLSGTASYPLPANYKSPRALVEGTIDNPMQIFNRVDLDSGEVGYALWNGNLVMKPMPTVDKTLNLYYYRFALPLANNNSVPEIDSQYHELLSAYAAAMILSMPGVENANKYLIDRYFSIWDEGRMRFKTDITKKQKQTTLRKVETWT